MAETWIQYLNGWTEYASTWGFAAIFFFMTVESSFVPFPSEVIMIPAGFLAARCELTFGVPWLDFSAALVCGVLGSYAGALINYFLAQRLGMPFLKRYGRYFLIKPDMLERACELFRKYGDMTTFVCRLLPAIRQLISLPAGLASMPMGRFTFFTCLGAGIWSAILAGIGAYIGHATRDLDYNSLIEQGKMMLHQHFGLILAGMAVFVVAYLSLQKIVMKSGKDVKRLP